MLKIIINVGIIQSMETHYKKKGLKTMTDYELTKRNDTIGFKLNPYLIRIETTDLEFLNFMDKKLDELIDEFYRDNNKERSI